MEIKLRICKKMPLLNGTSKNGSTYSIQEYVGETIEDYPHKILFKMINDKIKALEIDSICIVSFDINSRSWTSKDGSIRWSTDINAYKVERIANAVENQPMSAMDQAAQAYFDNAPKQQPINVPADGGHVEEGELPF